MLADSKDAFREQFYTFPQVYIQEVIKGFNEKQASDILLNAGVLVASNEKSRKYLTKLPHRIDPKRTRCYLLVPAIEDDISDREG
ncbi:hypothetical protein A1D23_07140 [Chelonobacter oris]|uniref:hypothetical protein n=1 Tax=Chelonobacter oris TaxID=505317 RepID=UPI00244D0825|nr:hypothetical protein [Chelonobacter oris]MDH2999867.1 hypothetical protein [Chelonobacter oris]